MRSADLAWRNECEGWWQVGKRSDVNVFRVEREGNVICAWWVHPVKVMLNTIMVLPGGEQDLLRMASQQGFIQTVRDSESASEIRIASSAGVDRDMLAELENLGWALEYSMPIMMCDLRKDVRPSPGRTDLTFQRVHDPESFGPTFDVIAEVFGEPVELNRFFVPDDGLVVPYRAMLNGKTVSAAVIWPFEGLMGIHSVSTLVPYRNRGYASSLLNYMMRDTADFSLASLRTTDSLIPLYGGLGFKEVGRVFCFRYRRS